MSLVGEIGRSGVQGDEIESGERCQEEFCAILSRHPTCAPLSGRVERSSDCSSLSLGRSSCSFNLVPHHSILIIASSIIIDSQFASKFAPLYQRRAEIIEGAKEPTDAEVEAGKASDSDVESEDEDEEEGAKISEIPEGDDNKDVAGIPAFWLTALRNHVPISETIEDRDEEALKALKDIKLSYLDDKPGFKLHFVFGKNDYFEDEELTKTYYYQVSVSFFFLCDFMVLQGIGTWWRVEWQL